MNFAIPVSKAELLTTLDDMRAGVESGDTLEGFIAFGIPYPPAGEPKDADWMLLTRYRIGNIDGQGGLRSVGAMEHPTTTNRIEYALHEAAILERNDDGFIVRTVLGQIYGFAFNREGDQDVLGVTSLDGSPTNSPVAANRHSANIKQAREAWREQFGGDVAQFDLAYRQALNDGATVAAAQAAGVNAVLDAFVERST